MSAPAPGSSMGPEDKASRQTSRLWVSLAWRFLVGLGVSAFFIWLTLKDRDLSLILEGARRAEPRWIAACILMLLMAHLVRTVRWGLLLSPLASFSFSHLHRACAVGFMALLLFPMRLGELGRPWLISRPDPGRANRSPVQMSAALGTLVIERVFDGALLTGMLFVLLSLGEYEEAAAIWLQRGAGLLFCAFVLVAGLLVLLSSRRQGALELAAGLLGRLGERARLWVMAVGSPLLSGIGGPGSLGGRMGFLSLSLLFWLTNAAAILLLARAFGVEMTLMQGLLVLGVQIIGTMIPAGPGMLGTFQYFTVLGLSLSFGEGLPETEAIALANLFWACLFAQHVALGLIFLPRRERVLTRIAAVRVGGGGGADRPVEDSAVSGQHASSRGRADDSLGSAPADELGARDA